VYIIIDWDGRTSQRRGHLVVHLLAYRAKRGTC